MEINFDHAAAKIIQIFASQPEQTTIIEDEAKNVLYPALQERSILARVQSFEKSFYGSQFGQGSHTLTVENIKLALKNIKFQEKDYSSFWKELQNCIIKYRNRIIVEEKTEDEPVESPALPIQYESSDEEVVEEEKIQPETIQPTFYHANKQYEYKKVLGKGAQGIVYLYKEIQGGPGQIAVKAAVKQNYTASSAALTQETKHLKKLSEIIGLKKYLPEFLDYTFLSEVYSIKLEYISQSLEDHLKSFKGQKDRTCKIVDVMLQMFDAIELLHSEAKLLHRDIKPDNFRYQDGCIKMIDFGLVMEYLDSQGVPFPQQNQQGFLGTPFTGSIDSLDNKGFSRKDDLESLAYNYMYMLDKKNIPWLGDKEILLTKEKKIEFLKAKNLSAEFQLIQKYIIETRKIEFVAEPPYLKLRKMIEQIKRPSLDADLTNDKTAQVIQALDQQQDEQNQFNNLSSRRQSACNPKIKPLNYSSDQKNPQNSFKQAAIDLVDQKNQKDQTTKNNVQSPRIIPRIPQDKELRNGGVLAFNKKVEEIKQQQQTRPTSAGNNQTNNYFQLQQQQNNNGQQQQNAAITPKINEVVRENAGQDQTSDQKQQEIINEDKETEKPLENIVFKQKNYKLNSEFERSNQAILYIFSSENDKDNKLLVKVAKDLNPQSTKFINDEINFMVQVLKIEAFKKYVPSFQVKFDHSLILIKEYPNQKIEEHIQQFEEDKRQSNLGDIIIQMFEAVQLLHQKAKCLHRNINLKNFRIDEEGQVKLINYEYIREILDNSQTPNDSSFLELQTASISVLEEKLYNQKDDLESLAYIFMILINAENVPWLKDSNISIIVNKKKAFLANVNTDDKFSWIVTFIKYVQNMNKFEELQYQELRLIIERSLKPEIIQKKLDSKKSQAQEILEKIKNEIIERVVKSLEQKMISAQIKYHVAQQQMINIVKAQAVKSIINKSTNEQLQKEKQMNLVDKMNQVDQMIRVIIQDVISKAHIANLKSFVERIMFQKKREKIIIDGTRQQGKEEFDRQVKNYIKNTADQEFRRHCQNIQEEYIKIKALLDQKQQLKESQSIQLDSANEKLEKQKEQFEAKNIDYEAQLKELKDQIAQERRLVEQQKIKIEEFQRKEKENLQQKFSIDQVNDQQKMIKIVKAQAVISIIKNCIKEQIEKQNQMSLVDQMVRVIVHDVASRFLTENLKSFAERIISSKKREKQMMICSEQLVKEEFKRQVHNQIKKIAEQELRSDYQNIEDQNKQLRDRIIELEQQKEQENNQLVEVNEQLSIQKHEYDANLSVIQRQLEEAKEKLTEKEELMKKLSIQNEEFRKQKEFEINNSATVNKTMNNYQSQLKEANELVYHLRNQIEAMKSKERQQQNLCIDFNYVNIQENFKEQLVLKTNNFSQLQKENDDLKQMNIVLQLILRDKNKEIAQQKILQQNIENKCLDLEDEQVKNINQILDQDIMIKKQNHQIKKQEGQLEKYHQQNVEFIKFQDEDKSIRKEQQRQILSQEIFYIRETSQNQIQELKQLEGQQINEIQKDLQIQRWYDQQKIDNKTISSSNKQKQTQERNLNYNYCKNIYVGNLQQPFPTYKQTNFHQETKKSWK